MLWTLQDLDESIMYMTSKYGQQHECNLPEVDTDKNNNNEDAVVENRPIAELLKSMNSNSCLVKVRILFLLHKFKGHNKRK